MVTVDLNNRTTTIGAKLTDAMSYIIPISLTQCFSLNGNWQNLAWSQETVLWNSLAIGFNSLTQPSIPDRHAS